MRAPGRWKEGERHSPAVVVRTRRSKECGMCDARAGFSFRVEEENCSDGGVASPNVPNIPLLTAAPL